jgi:hypothetical protein
MPVQFVKLIDPHSDHFRGEIIDYTLSLAAGHSEQSRYLDADVPDHHGGLAGPWGFREFVYKVGSGDFE